MSARSTIRVLAEGMSRPDLDDRRADQAVELAADEAHHPLLESRARRAGRARRSRAASASARARDRPSRRSTRSGRACRATGRRDRARARAPARTTSSSHSPTCVRTGRRPSGGVAITAISRRPAIDICSVRGIGVAERLITSVCSRSWRSSSFCLTPKRCSSSTTIRPEVLRAARRTRAVGACRSGCRPRLPRTSSASPSARPCCGSG